MTYFAVRNYIQIMNHIISPTNFLVLRPRCQVMVKSEKYTILNNRWRYIRKIYLDEFTG